MTPALAAAVARLTGRQPSCFKPLHGGSLNQVMRADFDDGPPLVIKQARPGAPLTAEREAAMLRVMGNIAGLRVPRLIAVVPELLILSHLKGSDGIGRAQAQGGAQLALLHSATGEGFGWGDDYSFGKAAIDNRDAGDWARFYGERRLLSMARQARDAGRLPAALMQQIETLVIDLPHRLAEPDAPRLTHGDLWSGNMMSDGMEFSGFIDPACAYAHPELDLATVLAFGGADDRFLAAYCESLPLAPGFDDRRCVYELWFLLCHVRLFGGGYVGAVRDALSRAN